MFCPNCGANIPDDSEFCEVCGAKVNEEPVKKASLSGGGSNNIKYIIAAVIVVVVVGLGAFVVHSMRHSGEGEVVLPGRLPSDFDTIEEVEAIGSNDVSVNSDNVQADKDEAKDADDPNVSNASNEMDVSGSETKAVSEKDSQSSQPAETSEATTASSEASAASSDAVDLGSSSAAPITAPTEDVTLSTFDWYYNEGFPTDGRPLTSLKEICGKWNCMITVTSEVSEGEQTRMLLTETEVIAADEEVKLLMHLKQTVDYYTASPDNKNFETPEKDVILTYNGSWDELMGYINASSQNSDLGIQLQDYVEVSGKQYAIGILYNGDIDIGHIVMVR